MDPEEPDESTARTWVDIDLGAIRRNVRALEERLPDGCATLMVVKADAYGHGLEAVARSVRGLIWGFGVAALDEAKRLRSAPPPNRSAPPRSAQGAVRRGWAAR